MSSKLVAALVAGTSSIALLACGGGSSSDTLSRADLVKKAQKICADAEKKSNAIQTPANVADATQAAPYFKKLAALAHQQDDQLRGLKPGDEVKADYQDFLAEEKTAVGLIDGIAAAAAAKDAAKGAELLQQASKNRTFKAAADKVGISSCAS